MVALDQNISNYKLNNILSLVIYGCVLIDLIDKSKPVLDIY